MRAIVTFMRWMFAFLMLISPAAFAEEDARILAFSDGRYEEAVSLADADASPDTLAFTARCRLAEAVSAPDYAPPLELLSEAEQLARRALATAPDHVEARLQLAIALSLKARPLSARQAMRTGFGEEARQLAESILEDDPGNAYAHGFLAVWHLEVRRRGGALGASIMGASVNRGRQHYRAALASAPGDAAIHWQYARALAALNVKKYRNDIDDALRLAESAPIETRLERLMQSRAYILQAVIKTEGRAEIQRTAAKML